MICQFLIDKFKSLADFSQPPKTAALPHSACIVDLNGAGKSTVLQAIDSIVSLMTGNDDAWLDRRGLARIDCAI